MAHILNIPVQVHFQPWNTSWSVVTAQILGWKSEFREPEPLTLTNSSLSHLTSGQVRLLVSFNRPYSKLEGLSGGSEPMRTSKDFITDVQLPVLPKSLASRFGPPGPDAVMPKKVKNQTYQILLADSPCVQNKQAVDATRLSNEFFALKKDNLEELLQFIRKWGRWDAAHLFYPLKDDGQFRQPGSPNFEFVWPGLVWEYRDACRDAIRKKPSAWLGSPQATINTYQQSEPPYFLVKPCDCRQVIEVSITGAMLDKVEFGVCARSDCRRIFKKKSNHRRAYCSQYCAHLVSVRKGRRATARLTGKSKKAR